MILLGYQHDRMCPKCHYMMGTTAYFNGFHGIQPHCPIGPESAPMTGPVSRLDYGTEPAMIELAEQAQARHEKQWARYQEQRNAIPEHFDRECPNCKYRWAEAAT